MCIHKEHLTELDIYHRILRFKNYMVAMMNKSLIPSKVILPIFGETVCFSRGLRYNIELILFRKFSFREDYYYYYYAFVCAAHRRSMVSVRK